MTTVKNFDFDPIYRGGHEMFGGTVPWSLGTPQPEIATVIESGLVRGEVLDAGCGEAALSLDLAARGFTTVGVDLSSAAIESARACATARDLANAHFEVADVTDLRGYDGRFDTIIDSALFHSMPVELRESYQRSMVRAAAPGARYFVLVFARQGAAFSGGANPVTKKELADAVSPFWVVDEIRSARHFCIVPDSAPAFPAYDLRDEPGGRKSLPAWLLSAHLA